MLLIGSARYSFLQPSLPSPDINIVQIELPYASEVIAKKYAPPPTSWALCAGLVAPKSRGILKLKSTNPADKPILDARLLSNEDDVAALAAGIEVCRELGNSKAMKPFAKREVAPGKKLDKAEMADFIRDGATTYFHEVGTCQMGKDKSAVVDASLGSMACADCELRMPRSCRKSPALQRWQRAS